MVKVKPPRKKPFPLNALPLVDVIFQLLIFFLLTSSFLARKAMEIDLPKSKTAEKEPKEHIVITLNARGEIFLDGKKTKKSHLEEELIKAMRSKKQKVTLQADRQVPLENLVEVMDAIRLSGAEGFELITLSSTASP